MPSSRQARITRTAISARLAIKTLANTDRMFTAVLGDAAKRGLAGSRFADVRWVEETGSTNVDLLTLARGGAAEGVVLVAEHQTVGRGRVGRSWIAPAGGSLLLSVLLRPPAAVAGLSSMAMGLAAADAIDEVAGFRPRLKWPNDLVWPGDGSSPDRKLAGILAEAYWPAESAVAVVVGIGVNVNWPADLPEELRDIATAINHVAGHPVDREDLLVHLLRQLDTYYDELVHGSLLSSYRRSSATLGRRVRVDLGTETIEGVAIDITAEGHLVVDDRTIAVGDVVHLRVEGPVL
jgi:BirA family biotin operon repressor/biotin-[acetyl-CoA-carboxylase] ligase